jgi:hypothetical protein
LIEIDVRSREAREVPDPHGDGNLNPPVRGGLGHLALVICGPFNEAKRNARTHGLAALTWAAWCLLGLYSMVGIDLLVLALWVYWRKTDRQREGPTRDHWEPALRDTVKL